MEGLLITLALLALGYFAGQHAEKKHYRSIFEREKQLENLPAVNLKNPALLTQEVELATLVAGNTVVAVDYFKVFLAKLRNIFGGRVASYESLLDRARREATLQLKEQAQGLGADLVMNIRVETSPLGVSQTRKSMGSVEALAYGTAIVYKK